MKNKTNKNHKEYSVPIYNVKSFGEFGTFDKIIDTVIKTLDKRDLPFEYYLPSKEHRKLLNHICFYLLPVTLTKKYEDGSWGAENEEQLLRLSQIIMILLPIIAEVDLTKQGDVNEILKNLVVMNKNIVEIKKDLEEKKVNQEKSFENIAKKLVQIYESDLEYNFSYQVLSKKLEMDIKLIESFFNSVSGLGFLKQRLISKTKQAKAKDKIEFWQQVTKWALDREFEVQEKRIKENLEYRDELNY